jgi:hypothetical protein
VRYYNYIAFPLTTYTIYKFVFFILPKTFLPRKCYFTSLIVFMLHQTLNLNMCYVLTIDCLQRKMWHTVHSQTCQQCDIECAVEPLSSVTYIAHLNHSRMWHTIQGSTTKLCDKQCAVEPLSSVQYSAPLSQSAMWHIVCSWTTNQLCSMVAKDVISEYKNNIPVTLCIKVQIYGIILWN